MARKKVALEEEIVNAVGEETALCEKERNKEKKKETA